VGDTRDNHGIYRSDHGDGVPADADGHADRSREPNGRCGGQVTHGVVVALEDHASAEKADTRNDLSSDTCRTVWVGKGGDEGKQARSGHDEAVRADPCGLVAKLAFDADHNAQNKAQAKLDREVEFEATQEARHVCLSLMRAVRC
jgi:hypothetical protein